MRDYYEILTVDPGATPDDIHSAYRSLALRFHPDRNHTPEAAATMALINEAYFILGEPSRRRKYDGSRAKPRWSGIAAPVLKAAYDTLLKQGWIVTQNDGSNLLLEQDTRAVRVSLVDRLDNGRLRKINRQFAGFCVVLAVEIETPINLSFHTAVIDLMRSCKHGADFPDAAYRALFSVFVAGR